MPFPSLNDFLNRFPTEEATISQLLDCKVFYETYPCSHCDTPMKRNDQKAIFRCNNYSCSKRSMVSMRIGTFFYGSRLGCKEILQMAHLWLAKTSVTTAVLLTGHSSATISSFFKHFRQFAQSSLKTEEQVIGGEGIEVQFDETKLGKRKYHRGHRVDGVWVVVGIERTNEAKVFLVPIENRSAETLREIIQTHVRPGSKVVTDCWKGYRDLQEFGLTHITVNHSQTFKDPNTNACTNAAEGLNSGIKRRIAPRNRTKDGIEMHLAEYIWRRQNNNNLFEAFINSIRDIHCDLE
jgi:transposase-like protein